MSSTKTKNLFFIHLNPQNIVKYSEFRVVVAPSSITTLDKLKKFLEFNSLFGAVVVYEVPLYFLFSLKDVCLKNAVYIMTALERSTSLQILDVLPQPKLEFEQFVSPIFSNKYINDWYHSKVERRHRPISKYTYNVISKLKQPSLQQWLHYEYNTPFSN